MGWLCEDKSFLFWVHYAWSSGAAIGGREVVVLLRLDDFERRAEKIGYTGSIE